MGGEEISRRFWCKTSGAIGCKKGKDGEEWLTEGVRGVKWVV